MRTTLKERVITVSLEGFEAEEMGDIRHRLSDVFGELEENVSVVVNSAEEEATPEESWFDREIVRENETDDEIFEDAILCVDPYNKRF
jgi:hypothetical protein